MFEELVKQEINILFDEWTLKKPFEVILLSIDKDTRHKELVDRYGNNKGSYLIFKAKFINSKNQFGIKPDVIVNLHISKKCFQKELIRHHDFSKGILPKGNLKIKIEKVTRQKIKFLSYNEI